MLQENSFEDDCDHNGHEFGLAGHVYDEIVQLILRGDLQAREPLRIHSLAAKLGVSATPVREALVRASVVGLVNRETNKGFHVAPRPDAAHFDELFEARIAVETRTAFLAAQYVDDKFIQALEETHERQQELGQDDSFEAFAGFLEADSDFHHLIATQARNRFLLSALEQFGSHEQRFRSFDSRQVTDRSETLVEHRAIIEALRTGNSMAAKAAMILHLTNLRQRVHNERIANA